MSKLSPTNPTPQDLHRLMREKFLHMEHYFVSEIYQPPAGLSHKLQKLHPHKPHFYFIYCGFIDSLDAPIQSRCWRSVSVAGLYRLVCAEDPDYCPDETIVPETRRRFSF